MKYRWPRVVLLIAALSLTLAIVVLGALVWLHSRGRLATLAQHLLHRFSGQEITFETIAFPSWNTVAFTNVRLQQQMPGWLLAIDCPHLEAHYSVSGLFNKRVNELHLQQPQIELSASDALPSIPSAPTTEPRSGMTLPVERLRIQQGTLRVHWRDQTYIVQQLAVVLRPQGHGHMQVATQGRLEENGTLQVATEVFFTATALTASLQLTADAVPLTLLTRLLSPTPPSAWNITQGTMHVEAALELQGQALHGTVTTHITHLLAQGQGMMLQNASLTSEARLAAHLAQPALQLDGQAQLQVEHLSKPPALTMTDVSLTGPWQISYAQERWHVTATPVLLGQTVEIGPTVRVTRLSLTTPIQLQVHPDTIQIEGMPAFTAQTLRLYSAGQTEATLHVADIQGQLAVHGTPTTMELMAGRLQTQAWHGSAVNDPPLLTALTLEGSGSLDLQRQQLTLPQLAGTLPQVGSIRGSGVWHWASHTMHDLRLRLAVSDITPLWKVFRHRLPAALGAWQTAGQWEIDLQATRLSLLTPRQVQGLTVTGQIHNGTLSTPEGTYASEHLNGRLHAAVAIDEATGDYTLQGTLTLQPFALLIGTLFPALEANQITSVVTFSAGYSTRTEHLQLYAASQLHDLGMITLHGTVHQPLKTPRYDLQLQARHINLVRLWSTFVHDSLQFPALSQARVQGSVNVVLNILSQSTSLMLRGTVDVVQGQFHTATWELHGLSLFLPIQLQYPLPSTAPEVATLPSESFGRLSIDTLQIGNVDMHGLSLRLAIWSDNIFIPEALTIPVLGGQIAIPYMTARHLLQSHRQLTLPIRLHHLDLQRVHRGPTKLPVTGILDGDFSPLQIHDNRLETHGTLTVQMAGGVIRISDLHGSEVSSTLPTFSCSITTETPLSLFRLTDIYPIGDIGGTLHFSVSDLTFVAREPTTFVLEFAVQEQGGEEREITIRALNNLLFTTGSAKVATGVFGDTYLLPYRHFGATVSLRDDTLRLRGKYHDSDGNEYFMQAPLLGGGVSIVNRVPNNGIPFRDFLQRLKATVLEKPEVQVR